MTTIEMTKEFLSGSLVGLKVVEQITTDFPENWYVGKIYTELITDSRVRIVDVIDIGKNE